LVLEVGVDVDLLIKAIATGSGGTTQFGIRAPWMAQRRFSPAQGTAPALIHYFDMIHDLAASVGRATPMLDRAAELFQRFVDMGLAEYDVARDGRCRLITAAPKGPTSKLNGIQEDIA